MPYPSFSYHKKVLPSGLRVLSVPLKTTGAVTVLVLVGAGSRYETRKNNGLAHFLEHLFFKGGKRFRDTRAVSEALDAVGADFNAFTSNEYAGYYVRLLAEETELAFDVLSDMLLHARLPEGEIEKERGVILEEYRMLNDTPTRKVSDLFENLIFAGSPMGFSTIGEPRVIRRLARRDFVEYREALYTPENIVLVVAGAITPDATTALAEKFFRFEKKTKALNSPATRLPQELGFRLLTKKTEQAHLVLGLPAFPASDARRYALKVLTTILGDGMSSRLFLNVREKHGLAYYIHSSDELYTDAGYFATAAGVDLRRIELALKLILEEYQRITKEPVQLREIKKAKERIRGSLILNLENPSNVAGYFGLQELLLKKVETPAERLKKIEQVTAAEIQKVAQELFSGGRALQLALIGPYTDSRPFLKLLRDARKNFSFD